MLRTVYLATTNDEYELPLFVADSQSNLAKKIGISPSLVTKLLNGSSTGKRHGIKIFKLRINLCKDESYNYY